MTTSPVPDPPDTDAPAAGGDAVAPAPAASDDEHATEPASAAVDISPAATGARLAALFPALIVGPDGHGTWRAIKLRIHADIQARAPGQFSKRVLGIFFARYTTTTAYLKALSAPGAQRHDLDGQPAGEVAEEHRAAAAEELGRRQAIAAERRAAQRKAQPQQRPAAPKHDHPKTRADQDQRPPRRRDAREEPRRSPHRPAADRPAAPSAPAAPPTDPAQRERALLLRAFETSPLSKANFCTLKRITEAELDAALALAREERQARAPRPA